MKIIEFANPRPYCLLSADHPARAVAPHEHTDVGRTFARIRSELYDDYALTDALHWLETPGTFK